MWKFKHIVSHEGHLNEYQPKYKISSYNVIVGWETGETNTLLLYIIAVDYPVTFYMYADDKKNYNRRD